MEWMEIVFWFSVAFVWYAYMGYPLALAAIAAARSRDVHRAPITPPVTFIITAYNEESRIGEKLENTLKQNYPRERFEVLVASDCSTDKTDEIALSYAGQGIRLIRASARKGKEAAQKLAVEAASGEILVFSDVATILPTEAIANIVENFRDPSVGCVSSVDRFIDKDGRVSGEGGYVRYEMFLRGLESRINSLVGLSGSFFAARRSVCQPWAEDLQSDFNTLLNAVAKGMRGVSDPQSIGCYRNLANEKKEYQRKVRTVLRGLTVLIRRRDMLNPFRYGIFAWQLFSHKLCRWLVPFAMILLALSTIMLSWTDWFYRAALVGQVGFMAMAAVGIWMPGRAAIAKLPGFFVMVNMSILEAWLRYAKGERVVAWQSSQR